MTKSPGVILDGDSRPRADRLERSATSSASAVDGPEGARPRTGRVTGEAQDGPSTGTIGLAGSRRLRTLTACAATLLAASLTAASASPPQGPDAKLQWRSVGPYIGGRVVAIAGVPSQPDLFYMGAVDGGVWKSVNYGVSWTNITDHKLGGTSDSIGAIAVAPSNAKVI